MADFAELTALAASLAHGRDLPGGGSCATVAAAIEAASGRVYTGVCIDVACSMGFCAEHAAIAAMVTAGETCVRRVVAVHEGGSVVAPCGRCREFLYQINHANLDAEILLAGGVTTLRALLPHIWNE